MNAPANKQARSTARSMMRVEESFADRVRSRVPDAAIPAVARLGAFVLGRSEFRRAFAREEMDALVGLHRTPEEVDALVPAYIRYWAWRSESRRHIHHQTDLAVEGVEHLVRLKEEGRAVILSFIHHGPWEGGLASIARHGGQADIIVSSGMVQPDGPRHMHDVRRKGTSTGTTVFDVAEGARGIFSRLDQKKVVGISFDVRGDTETTFLGRRVRIATSNVAIATRTNTPIVVFAMERRPGGPVATVSAPFEPGDYATPADLHAAIKERHEAAADAWPEAYEQPTFRMDYLDFPRNPPAE